MCEDKCLIKWGRYYPCKLWSRSVVATVTGAVPRRCSSVVCAWEMSLNISSLFSKEIWVRIYIYFFLFVMYSCIYLFVYLFKKLNNQIELRHRSNLQGNFLNIHKLFPPSLFHQMTKSFVCMWKSLAQCSSDWVWMLLSAISNYSFRWAPFPLAL